MHDINPLEIRDRQLRIVFSHVRLADQIQRLRLLLATDPLVGKNRLQHPAHFLPLAGLFKQPRLGKHHGTKNRRAHGLLLEPVEPHQRGLIVPPLHLQPTERRENPVLLQRPGIPPQRVTQHLLTLPDPPGLDQGIPEIHQHPGTVHSRISVVGRPCQKTPRQFRIGLHRQLGLRVDQPHRECLATLRLCGLALFPQHRGIGLGLAGPPVKARERLENLFTGPDAGIVARLPKDPPMHLPRLLDLAGLPVIPPHVPHRLADPRRLGPLGEELLHQLPVALGLLQQFQPLGRPEDALLIGLRVIRRDRGEHLEPLLKRPLVHHGVSQKHLRLAVLGLPGKFLQIPVQFVDRLPEPLHLLQTIRLPEHRRPPIPPVGLRLEVGIHQLTALVVLLVVGMRHPEPIRRAVGHPVLRMPHKKIPERLGAFHVPLGEQQAERPHEARSDRIFRVRMPLGNTSIGRDRLIIHQGRLHRLGLEKQCLGNMVRRGEPLDKPPCGIGRRRPVLKRRPAPHHIQCRLLGQRIRGQLPDHPFHHLRGLLIPLHPQIRHGQPEPQRGVETLYLLEILQLPPNLGNQPREQKPRVGIQ